MSSNKETVTLFGLDIEVSIDFSNVFSGTYGDTEYEECYITDDNRLIAFDEAVCAWVQLSADAKNAI